MKLLLFAHTPPPHHGQSVMISLMLDGFGGDRRRGAAKETPIACYHVNARFSDGMDDIGRMRGGKGVRLLRYVVEALWCRFRYGARVFYHVPAPGKRSALYRDWVILLLCRPFFDRWIMHWHAVGLRQWLDEKAAPWERAISLRLYAGATLGITLTESNRGEAASFDPRRIAVVPNGIPDPCPDYRERIQPLREARARECLACLSRPLGVGETPLLYRLLFLGHCTREKGLFDTLEAVALLNADPTSRLRVELVIAGNFLSIEEETLIRERIAKKDLAGAVTYFGFAGPREKARLLEACDALCFPGYYHAESFGLVLLEAMAYGASLIATHWRATPELLPPGYPGLVPIRDPQAIAATLPRLAALDLAGELRAHFEANFTVSRHLERLREAILRVEDPT